MQTYLDRPMYRIAFAAVGVLVAPKAAWWQLPV